jgi:hypothetical protein
VVAVAAGPLIADGFPQDISPEDRAASAFADADALLRMGRVRQAREGFELIIAEYPAAAFPAMPWRAAARVRLGDLRWRAGAHGLAAVEYTLVLDEEPASAWASRARIGLATVAQTQGDWIAAADMLERVVVAAERGGPDGDLTAGAEAGRRLALLDRFRIRPMRSEPPWTGVSTLVARDLALDRPVAIAASADGQLLIVDEGLPAVLLIDAGRQMAARLAYNEHGRPWWGSDGLPYLPTRRSGVIALGGSHVGFLASEGGRAVPLKSLQAGARTPAGRWYLIDADPTRLLRFGSEGDFQGLATEPGEQPVDLAIDDTGRLHMLDGAGRSVVRFLPDGRREGTVIRGTWRRPEAIEIDDLGNIYVLDRDDRTVDVYDAQGTRLQRLGPVLPGGVSLRAPRDLAVDGEGRLYIADRSASSVLVCW